MQRVCTWEEFTALSTDEQTARLMTVANKIVDEVGMSYVDLNATSNTGEGCEYVKTDPESGLLVPSCLIGRILVAVGFPIESLYVRCKSLSIMEVQEQKILDDGVHALTYVLMAVMQTIQDKGGTWWLAVMAAGNARRAMARGRLVEG